MTVPLVRKDPSALPVHRGSVALQELPDTTVSPDLRAQQVFRELRVSRDRKV